MGWRCIYTFSFTSSLHVKQSWALKWYLVEVIYQEFTYNLFYFAKIEIPLGSISIYVIICIVVFRKHPILQQFNETPVPSSNSLRWWSTYQDNVVIFDVNFLDALIRIFDSILLYNSSKEIFLHHFWAHETHAVHVWYYGYIPFKDVVFSHGYAVVSYILFSFFLFLSFHLHL